jgi:hypothetical protein
MGSEIELRAALRQVIINAGGAASEGVSDEFLMLAPEEVRLLHAKWRTQFTRIKELEEALRQAGDIFQVAIEQGYPQPEKTCEHGKFSWEDCVACYDEFLIEKVAEVRALAFQLLPTDSGRG